MPQFSLKKLVSILLTMHVDRILAMLPIKCKTHFQSITFCHNTTEVNVVGIKCFENKG